ncbi:MAG: electron transfer flavoprotein subunit beta/FixA family protein [Acidobacteria bacterium]|nr:electron transfer flavoprotein subunit beta/FixA family protein [Acidobacteriota bacterium]
MQRLKGHVAQSALNIIVLIKHVPDAQFDRRLAEDSHRMDRSESILSELDEYALEAALALSEQHGGKNSENTVTAVTVGPPAAVAAVKKALQIGATAGVHLSDEALAGSDAAATSAAIAVLIQHLGTQTPVDLVLTGMASTDGETSLVPAQLAARLGLAQLTQVSALSLSEDGATLMARRDGDTETLELQASLPAVVSVTDQINEPRYPNFKGILAAKKKKVTTLTLADLGLDPALVGASGSWTEVLDAAPRPARAAGTIVSDTGDAGIQLVDFLAAQKLL